MKKPAATLSSAVMPGQGWTGSFAIRLAIATSILIVFACGVLSVILVRRDLAMMQRSLVERANTISELLVRESELSVLSGDTASLRQLAEVAMEQTDVAYCRFFDADGAILTVVGSPPITAPVQPLQEPGGPVQVTDTVLEFQRSIYTRPLRARGEELAFVASGGTARPAAGLRQRVGTVALGIALGPLFELRRNAYVTAAFFAFVVALIASMSALLLARAFTRPLEVLAGAAKTVAHGDLSVNVNVESRDEVASVAHAFNAMVASLAESRATLQDYSLTLEARSKRLEELNRQLEEANRLRSEFMAQVSHELRTPLHVIIGYTNMLEEGAAGDITDEQRELLRSIEQYSKLQLDLVTNVLDFSRLASGQMTYHVERFALLSLLADILRLQQSTLQRPELQTKLEVAADLPDMETDRIKLQEVVRNLIDNAFKFTPAGTVCVRAQRGSTPEQVIIEVSDTGAGIPPEHLDTVFHEFLQLGASSTRSTHGVGLGLSIVKQLVTALGGTISVNSAVGEGSTFRIELPARLPDVSRSNAQVRA